VVEVLDRVAKRHEATIAQVAIAWLVAKKEVSTVILGARTTAQLDDNLRAAEVPLTAEDVKELDDASVPDWGYPYAMIGRTQAW
jgi:aryl-alcohol dehydrogenase-like predicted oxidoreductase